MTIETVSPVDEAGKPREVFLDADSAWTYADEIWKADQQANGEKRRVILAIEQGAAPSRASSVRANEANLNWRESARVMGKAQELYSAYCLEETHPFEVKLKRGREVAKDQISLLVSKSANTAWATWEGRDIEIGIAVREMVRYGLGGIYWPDSVSPQFEAVLREDILFEAESPLDVDKHFVIGVRRRWTAYDLFKILDNENASDLGWNVSGIRELLKVLAVRAKSNDMTSNPSWEEIERQRHANVSGLRKKESTFLVYVLASRNPDTGKVDIHIVSEYPAAPNIGSVKRDFLRTKLGAYQDFRNFIQFFPRYLHFQNLTDIRGVGHEVTPMAIASSRTKNRALNSFGQLTTSWFSAPDTQAAMRSEARTIATHGNFGFVPASLSVVEMPQPDLKSSFSIVGQWLNGEMYGELSHDARDAEPGKPERQQIPALDRLSIEERKAVLYFLSQTYAEVYRRMHKGVDPIGRDFHSYLEYYGIPVAEAGPSKLCYVRASRPIGDGSLDSLREISGAMLSVRSMAGSEGAHQITKLFARAWVGENHVDQFVPSYYELQQPDVHQRQAHQEHNQALAGQEVFPPVPSDDHVQHLQQHFTDLEPDMEFWATGQGEQDPEFMQRFGRYLMIMVPHLKIHSEQLSADPTMKPVADGYRIATEELVRTMNKVLAGLEALQRQAEANAQRAQAQQLAQLQEAAQAPPPPDPGTMQKLQFNQEDHVQKLTQRQEEHQQNMAIKAQEAQVKQWEARQKLEGERAKLELELSER